MSAWVTGSFGHTWSRSEASCKDCDSLGLTEQLLGHMCVCKGGGPRRDNIDVSITQLGCFTKLWGIYLHIHSRSINYCIIMSMGSTGVCVENFPTVAHNVFQRQPFLTWPVFSRNVLDGRGVAFQCLYQETWLNGSNFIISISCFLLLTLIGILRDWVRGLKGGWMED